MTTDTPRTDAYNNSLGIVPASFARELERELDESKADLMRTQIEMQLEIDRATAEVERLKELLNRAINEIEKTPFHTPKLTAFTAHRLADRYREKMTNTSTNTQNTQEDDK